MMKKSIIICLLALFSAASCSYASDMDILVQKLVDKGVLTPGEGQQILTETKEEIRKEMAQGKVAGVPQWVQDIKLKGDFRLRYQWDKAKQAASTDSQRDRARIRLRIGAETRVVDNFNVGLV
jgi:polyhydroxyalkanoate synthesis regulator phasin